MAVNTKKQAFLPKDKSTLPRTFKAAAWLGWLGRAQTILREAGGLWSRESRRQLSLG